MSGARAEPKAAPLRVPVSDVPVRHSILAPEQEPDFRPMKMEEAKRPSVVSRPVHFVSENPSRPLSAPSDRQIDPPSQSPDRAGATQVQMSEREPGKGTGPQASAEESLNPRGFEADDIDLGAIQQTIENDIYEADADPFDTDATELDVLRGEEGPTPMEVAAASHLDGELEPEVEVSLEEDEDEEVTQQRPARSAVAFSTVDLEVPDLLLGDAEEDELASPPRKLERATLDIEPEQVLPAAREFVPRSSRDASVTQDLGPADLHEPESMPAPPRGSVVQPPPPPERLGHVQVSPSVPAPSGGEAGKLVSSPLLAEVVSAPPPSPSPPRMRGVASHRVSDLKPSRPRKHHWWETFFDDDYLRTVRMPSREAVARKADFVERRLGLVAGATVLDVGCGWGVDVVELSSRGYLGVGMDLSLAMLSRAADEAQDRGQRINFLHADMREMNFDGTFDAVMCLGTTFGYFDDEMNRLVIERLFRALKPQGVLLLEMVNRDHVIRSQPNLVWFEGDGCVCMEESEFNYFTSRLHIKRTVILDDGKQRENEYSLRLYSLHEVGQMLHHQGFRVTEVSGRAAVPGVFFGQESPDLFIVAERRADPTGKHSLPPSDISSKDELDDI